MHTYGDPVPLLSHITVLFWLPTVSTSWLQRLSEILGFLVPIPPFELGAFVYLDFALTPLTNSGSVW